MATRCAPSNLIGILISHLFTAVRQTLALGSSNSANFTGAAASINGRVWGKLRPFAKRCDTALARRRMWPSIAFRKRGDLCVATPPRMAV